jgi:hypothetical protein
MSVHQWKQGLFRMMTLVSLFPGYTNAFMVVLKHLKAMSRPLALSTWTASSSRRRSLSIDSMPESDVSSPPISPSALSPKSRSNQAGQGMKGIIRSADFAPLGKYVLLFQLILILLVPLIVPIYRAFRDEVKEARDLHVPGETESSGKGRPVRLLDSFTIYDHNDGTYLPFALVAFSILSGTLRSFRASGTVSRCLEDSEDGDSDSAEVESELLVSLRPLVDFWVDYNTGQLSVSLRQPSF